MLETNLPDSRLIDITLLTDGSSDRVLLHPIRWILSQHGFHAVPRWADLSSCRRLHGLNERITAALELYPCKILIVHRDAEDEARDVRVAEITTAVQQAGHTDVFVCLVPVRMSEAWFLFSETAIRRAAGNPNGRIRLELPRPQRVEGLADPKSLLFELLEQASEARGRRRARFDPAHARQRVGELIDDYAPLRRLDAFSAFEQELAKKCETLEDVR